MKLTNDQVKHVAKLANLSLTEEEVQKFADQLSETVTYVEQLEQVDTANIEPTNQVTGLVNVTREDETKPSLSQAEALKNTKSKVDGFFKVPAVLGGK